MASNRSKAVLTQVKAWAAEPSLLGARAVKDNAGDSHPDCAPPEALWTYAWCWIAIASLAAPSEDFAASLQAVFDDEPELRKVLDGICPTPKLVWTPVIHYSNAFRKIGRAEGKQMCVVPEYGHLAQIIVKWAMTNSHILPFSAIAADLENVLYGIPRLRCKCPEHVAPVSKPPCADCIDYRFRGIVGDKVKPLYIGKYDVLRELCASCRLLDDKAEFFPLAQTESPIAGRLAKYRNAALHLPHSVDTPVCNMCVNRETPEDDEDWCDCEFIRHIVWPANYHFNRILTY